MNQTSPAGTFVSDLQLGNQNENILIPFLNRRGFQITQTSGKHIYDGIDAQGRSWEVKLDLMSQVTGRLAIEEPTMLKDPDILIQTLCYAKVITREERLNLWKTGKLVKMGTQLYDGRVIPLGYLKPLPFIRDI